MIFSHFQLRWGIAPIFFGASVIDYLPILRRHMTWFGFMTATKKEMIRGLTTFGFPAPTLFTGTPNVRAAAIVIAAKNFKAFTPRPWTAVAAAGRHRQ